MIKICLVTTTDSLDVLIPGEPAPSFQDDAAHQCRHRHVAAGHAASPPWATAERCGVRAMNAAEIAYALGDARRPARVWRCLCPLHGGHSLLRATAVKFNLTMAPTAGCPSCSAHPHSRREASNGIDTRQAGHHKQLQPGPQSHHRVVGTNFQQPAAKLTNRPRSMKDA